MNVRDLIEARVKFNTNDGRCAECERTLREMLFNSIKYLAANDLEMKFEIGSSPNSRLCKALNEDATQFAAYLHKQMKALPEYRHTNEVFVAIIVRHVTAIATLGFEAYIESLPTKSTP